MANLLRDARCMPCMAGLFALLTSLAGQTRAATPPPIFINEILADNEHGALDDNNTHQDWVELYNASPDPINLAGYAITDSPVDATPWVFPSVTIGRYGFLTIWASGKNRTSPALHTDFQLEKDGEFLGLFMPDGTCVDYIAMFPPQEQDVSYGRKPDGSPDWVYFGLPTPGTSNTTPGRPTALPQPDLQPPVCSPAGGFYLNSVAVTITSTDPGVQIRYTLDGTVPMEWSALYQTPIALSQPTALRARAFLAGKTPSAVATNSYLINQKTDMPTMVLVTEPASLWGGSGIYDNPMQLDWKRPVTVEYYETGGARGFAIDAGVSIHGGASRDPSKTDKHSFTLHFNSDYGPPHLDYPLFPDIPETQYDGLVIRAGYNDSWSHWIANLTDSQRDRTTFVRDPLINRLLLAMGEPASRGGFARLYLIDSAGTLRFWGLYNPTEQINGHMLDHQAGGNDWDIITAPDSGTETVAEGDAIEWNSLNSWLNATDLTSDANFAILETRLDIENFTEYIILNIWGVNTDWPHHNYYFARERVPDGKWIALPWDSEYCVGLVGDVSTNMMGTATNTSGPAGRIFAKMLQNAAYRLYFLQRCDHKLNTSLHPSSVLPIMEALFDMAEPGIPDEAARWVHPEWTHQLNYDDWLASCQRMRDFVNQRPAYMRQHLIDYFAEATATGFVTVAAPQGGPGGTQISGIELSSYPWTGTFVQGVPIELRAEPANGFRFVRWGGATLPPERITTVYPQAPIQQMLITEGSEWYYDDTGNDLHEAWRTIPDRAGWKLSRAELGYGDGGEATLLYFGTDSKHKFPCYYFRYILDVPDPSAITDLKIDIKRDDGAVVYIQGNEAFRDNMRDGETVIYTTLAKSNLSSPAEHAWNTHTIDPQMLDPGLNVIAVEIHQAAVDSADVSFDLRMYATQYYTVYPVFEPRAGDIGTERWRFQTGGHVRSSAALASDGTIYFGCEDGKLYALRPDGTKKWEFPTGDSIRSSPMIAPDSTIYIGSKDGSLYAVNPDGTQKWRYTQEMPYPLGNVDAIPSLGHDGTVYFGAQNGKFYALHPEDGSVKWVYRGAKDNIQSQALIGPNANVYFGSDDGKLYALGPDGTELWTFPTAGQIRSSPAFTSEGLIVFGDMAGTFWAVDQTGEEVWHQHIGVVRSSPVLAADGTIHVGVRTGNFLYALNPANGSAKWKFDAGSGADGNLDGSAAVGADGTIYVARMGGRLFALAPNPPDPNNVQPLWWFNFEGDDHNCEASPVIAADGTLYLGSDNGYLFAIKTASMGLADSPWAMIGRDVRHTAQCTSLGTASLVVVNGSGSGTYFIGQLVRISAYVPPGFRFDRWTGDTAGIANVASAQTTIVVQGDATIAASFVQQFRLTVVNGTGSGAYDVGSVVPIRATVPLSFRFDRWTGGTQSIADLNAPNTTITMLADAAVTATFVRQFALTVVNGIGSGIYDTGTVVPIVAALPAGYRFDKWTGDTANVANVNSPSTTVTMLSNTTVTAAFVRQFALTVVNGTGSGIYDTGTVVPIEATIPPGYRFEKWTGDTAHVADVRSASTSITMLGDAVVTATLVQQFTLTITNGTGTGVYDIGAMVSVEAIIPSNHRFGTWTGDTANVADVSLRIITVMMLSDTSLTATFVRLYTLGVVNGWGSGVYDEGAVMPITADVPAGYGFEVWAGDTANVAEMDAGSTTIRMLADATVTATFVQFQYVLTVTGGAGSGTYGGGSEVVISAPPREGYYFAEWVGDTDYVADPYSASTTVTMLMDTKLVASYMRVPVPVVVNLSVQPSSAVIPPGQAGQFCFDVVVDRVDRCNGLTLWAVVTRGGDPQEELTFDHAQLLPAVTETAQAMGARLIDTSAPYEAMISWMISPPNPSDYGPTIQGAIARFYYNYTVAARGTYELGMDSTPIEETCWSTRTAFGRGTGVSVDWIPKWAFYSGQRVDFFVLNLGAGSVRFAVPGDVNGDDCVNVADLLTVRNNLGRLGSGIPADVCGNDNAVNIADLLFVRNRMGQGPGCH